MMNKKLFNELFRDTTKIIDIIFNLKLMLETRNK